MDDVLEQYRAPMRRIRKVAAMKKTALALITLGLLTACGVDGAPNGFENGMHVSGDVRIGVTNSQ